MIKTFLIYKVIERCIDVLFNRIDANLCLPDDRFKVGNRFTELATLPLSIDYDDILCTASYFNAVILENNGTSIKFKFDWYSIVMDNVDASDDKIERMRNLRLMDTDPNIADMQIHKVSDYKIIVVKAFSVPVEDHLEIVHIDFDSSIRDLG